MRVCLWIARLWVLMALLASQRVSAGDLSDLRLNLHAEDGAGSPSKPRDSKTECHDRRHSSPSSSFDDDSDDGDSLTAQLAGLAVLGAGVGLASPIWAPHLALDDDLGKDAWFPKHPYRETDGALAYDEAIKGTHDSLIVLQGVYGNDLDDMRLFNGRAILEHRSRWGLDTEFFYRHEDLSNGGNDELWHGDLNLTYRFAQSEHWLFRAGAGANWISSRGTDDVGFNLTYGAEWFPLEPLVVTGTIDWGKIASASLFHGRAMIGVTKNGWGVFTGYDYFRVSDTGISSWISGVELRF